MTYRLLLLLLVAFAANGAVAAQDCPPPSVLLGDGSCAVTATASSRFKATTPMTDSVEVTYRIRFQETFFEGLGQFEENQGRTVRRYGIRRYIEWDAIPGTPYYSVVLDIPGVGVRVDNGPQGAGRIELAATALFGEPVAASSGTLLHSRGGGGTEFVDRGDPDTDYEQVFQNNIANLRSRIMSAPLLVVGVYAALDPALTTDIVFEPDSVTVGEPFEALVTVTNPWAVQAEDIRPDGPLVITDAGGQPAGDAVMVTEIPDPLAEIAGGSSGVLRYTLIVQAEGIYAVEAPVVANWPRYGYTVRSESVCGAASSRLADGTACEIDLEDGLRFTPESAFTEADSLFWPDTTYTLQWVAPEIETVEIHASLKRDPNPENDADWPIVVATGLDASSGTLDWKVPVEATSPTVRLRIRDEEDTTDFFVGERSRVRYGWQLTRVATDPSGEKRYEAFDPTFHAWRDDAPNAVDEWIERYYTRTVLSATDDVASRAAGRGAEMDVEMDYRLGKRGSAYVIGPPLTGSDRFTYDFPPLADYIAARRDRVARSLALKQGTPSWRAVAFAYGLQNTYGSESPVLVTGPSPDGALMSQVNVGISRTYSEMLGSGTGLCYGMAWSALLAFHNPDAFADWYRPLNPRLQSVRELSTLPIDDGTLDVIGAVFVTQNRSLGQPPVAGTLARLQATLESDEPEDDLVLANFGHAVLPYRIETTETEAFNILVHNRTIPGRVRDGNVGVFTSTGGAFTGGPNETGPYGFSRQAYTDFLSPVPVPSVYSREVRTVQANSFTEIEISEGSTRRGEIPQPISLFRDDPDLPSVGYVVPEGPFQFTLRGNPDGFVTATVAPGDGTTYEFSRSGSQPTEIDSLAVSENGLTYVGLEAERDVQFGVTVSSGMGSQIAEIGPFMVGAGESTTVRRTGDGVRVTNGGPRQVYDLALMATSGGFSAFTARSIEIGAGAIHTVRPDWSALEGGDITIDVDDDGDGTPDRILSVAQATPDEEGTEALPSRLALGAPFPNPTAGAATIPYAVPTASRVRLTVVDALGREVAQLVDGDRAPGSYRASLDTQRFAPGIYVVRIEAGRDVATQTLTVVR